MKIVRYIFILLLVVLVVVFYQIKKPQLPLVSIANYGPHASLEASIQGMKQHLETQGYIENDSIAYAYMDVGFDRGLIGQMVQVLYNQRPDVVVTLTTPIAQYVKGMGRNTPVVYSTLTDPYVVGIAEVGEKVLPVAVSTDQQSIKGLLLFISDLLPSAKRLGILYAPSESNDVALVSQLTSEAKKAGITLVAISVDHPSDIPIVMQKFEDNIDVIFVGASGPIQPSIPIIAQIADSFNIPVINMDDAAVKEGLVLASFGVNYEQVGKNTAVLVRRYLEGHQLDENHIIYPSIIDHKMTLSLKQAERYNVDVSQLNHVEILE